MDNQDEVKIKDAQENTDFPISNKVDNITEESKDVLKNAPIILIPLIVIGAIIITFLATVLEWWPF